jgi:capsular exopolysaccharide synthesis family protein
VVLIDADLRRPTQHRLAERPRSPGLSEVLLGEATLATALQTGLVPRLDFLPSGGAPNFALGLLHTERLRALIASLRERYDKIIFDSPPIIGVSDAAVLAGTVDGVVLLIQHRRNPASMVLRAQQTIASLRVPLLGAVLNQVPKHSGEDYDYYTHNYTYYGAGEKSAPQNEGPGRTTAGAAGAEKLTLSEPGRKG